MWTCNFCSWWKLFVFPSAFRMTSVQRNLVLWRNTKPCMDLSCYPFVRYSIVDYGCMYTWCPSITARAPAQNGAVFRHWVSDVSESGSASPRPCTWARAWCPNSGVGSWKKVCSHKYPSRIVLRYCAWAPSVNVVDNLRKTGAIQKSSVASSTNVSFPLFQKCWSWSHQ